MSTASDQIDLEHIRYFVQAVERGGEVGDFIRMANPDPSVRPVSYRYVFQDQTLSFDELLPLALRAVAAEVSRR